jgi:SAM-dependent MidA family methyltransferase
LSNELSALIRDEIRPSGSIPFDRFMELALYHPMHGYYRREGGKPRTGREGDFFTSVSVGPLFGRLLAKQFMEMWERMEKPAPFWIIEQGGEDARLACDILSWCRDEASDFFAALRYAMIEDAPASRNQQGKTLGSLSEKMTWLFSTMTEQKPDGIFFSNELVDAFPVRRVVCRKDRWLELQVGLDRTDDFVWIEKEITDGKLAEAVNAPELPTSEGCTTEINLRARAWVEEAGRMLQRGYFLTIDYGFPASAKSLRVSGTLTAYQKHQRTGDVLREPGSRDITAHVDFTALARAGEKAGWTTLGFLDQQHFLMGIAHDELSEGPGPRTGIRENLRAWQTLIHPEHLGARFQVLLQARDAPDRLAGLRYARGGL